MWPEWLANLIKEKPPASYQDTLAHIGQEYGNRWNHPVVDRMRSQDIQNPNLVGLHRVLFNNRTIEGDTIHLYPGLTAPDQPKVGPSPLGQQDYRNSLSRNYVLGHEYGHHVSNRNVIPSETIGQLAQQIIKAPYTYANTPSEMFAQAFGDAVDLARATDKGGYYGPEVRSSIDQRRPGTEALFRWLMSQPVYKDHPLRGWAAR